MSNKQERLAEGSMAMNSLKPGSNPVTDDPKSKFEILSQMIGAAHTMSSDELTKWFNDAMALIGHEASHLPPHANEMGNEASIRMKPSHAVGHQGAMANFPMPQLNVKEDVEAMFSGQDLSEEFKERASTLFETAINARLMVEQAKLEESYEAYITETVETLHEEMVSKVDSYLDYVVEQWMEENQVAVESSLRNELMGDFISGLKNLFAEHYIELPEEQIDIVESLANKVEQLEEHADSLIVENVELKKAFKEVERDYVVESFLDNMPLSQQEKFKALVEGVDFDGNIDTYARKLSIIKENYFGVESKPVVHTSNIIEESFEGEVQTHVTSIDPSVNKYVQAISRSVKK